MINEKLECYCGVDAFKDLGLAFLTEALTIFIITSEISGNRICNVLHIFALILLDYNRIQYNLP